MHDYMMALAIKLITETQFGAYFKNHQNTMKFHQIYDLVRVIKQAAFERFRDLISGVLQVMTDMDALLIGEFTEKDTVRHDNFQKHIKNFQATVRDLVESHREARYLIEL